jgi:hypothetical protein
MTRLQEEDACGSLRVERIVDLPEGLKALWNQVPPDLPGISEYLKPVRSWLAENARPGDYVLIQGDFGATYLMVEFAFEKGLVPIYSTSKREATEEHAEDGSVKLSHRFEHQRFRRYGE